MNEPDCYVTVVWNQTVTQQVCGEPDCYKPGVCVSNKWAFSYYTNRPLLQLVQCVEPNCYITDMWNQTVT